VSTTDAAGIEDLLKKLEKRYKDAEPSGPRPDPAPEDVDPIEHLLWSTLLWDATPAKAREAHKRLTDAASDLNELRVLYHEELVALLGPRYPLVDERAARLKMVLNDVYNRHHAVTLEPLAKAPKREARKTLDELDGATPFIAARTMALGLGGHAIPVDEKLRVKLVEEGVLDEGADCAAAAGSLERVIKASDGLRAVALFEAWTADDASRPASRKTRKKASKKVGRKKTTRQSSTTKKTTRSKRKSG
jgi:endonuclease III